MSRAFWDPGAGLYGMFDVWHFTGCDSVVSSGLGGGSLIYANVLLRKDEHWFVQDDPLPHGGYESWPVTRADLDPHYDEVERMLGATPYPLGVPRTRRPPRRTRCRTPRQNSACPGSCRRSRSASRPRPVRPRSRAAHRGS